MDGNPAAGPTAVAACYRRFLLEAGVENDFYAVKALVQRVPWAARERQGLRDQAAAAEVEAGRLGRAHDEEQRCRFGFTTGTAIAGALAAVDAVPAYLAAQAFGLDQWTTIGISVVLVAALAAAMWVVAHHPAGWRRWVVAGALATGLLAIGALRWWYLVVTTGDQTAAVLEAAGLTIFTALLVWFGVVVLGLTRARHVSAAERRARSLRRRAQRATAGEAEAGRRADMAMREFIGRAQVFASRDLDDTDARALFLAHVRCEVEQATAAALVQEAVAPRSDGRLAPGSFALERSMTARDSTGEDSRS
jgi:hypothetical protein